MKKIVLYLLCIIFGVIAFILIYKINKDNEMNVPIKDNTQLIDENDTPKIDVENIIQNETIIDNNNEIKETIKNDFSSIDTFKEENYERYMEYKNNNQNLANEEIVMRVNVYLDYNFYENIIDAINKNTPLILVNKYYRIDESYVPQNLVEVSTNCASGSGIYADSEAVNQFTLMCTDASTLGLTIKTISAYRSYDYQKKLYEGYLKNDSVMSVDTYSARPGHSEHQTGYAFDVYNVNVTYTSFGETNEFEWVKNNAHKYGFIIRYTESNSYITGYKNEPWHLRYVGLNAAKNIYENNITLEEYLLNKK